MSYRFNEILASLTVTIGLIACSSSDPGTGFPSAGGSTATAGGATGQGQGGASNGGTPGNGGAATNGGTAQATGGSSSTGGSVAGPGGSGNGGSATGGATATGGKAAGGSATGGAATGGKAAGGASTGGAGVGGAATGGKATGGAATGGKAAGGTATGGAASGGTTTSTGGTPGTCTPPKAGTKSTNPLFTDVYTADPGALVHNCTFYINCGHDEGAGTSFVMRNWYILKSTDMVNWTRIDNALTLGAFKWANANAWAGQMVTKGGKFYWFVPVNKTGSCPNNCGMAIGVAVGDSPEGPFTDYLGKPLIDDLLEMSNWNLTLDSDSPFTIDPTVFIDDDGQAYLQYGGFGKIAGAKLNLDGNNVSLNGKLSYVTGLDGVFEAPFLTKINGTYYNVYAAGVNPAKIDYATSSNPMGPFKYRGRILDSLPTNSTDAATSHPAIAQFAGQWYLVYHISDGPNGGGTYHRMVAVDKITVAANGDIAKITPTKGMQF